jgi:hypothetical protein
MLSDSPLQRLLALSPVFILIFAMSGCTTSPAPNKVTDAGPSRFLPPSSNTFAKANVQPELLLNRLTWGSNFSAYQQLQAVGMDKFLDQQLRGRASVVPPTVQAQISAMTISQQPIENIVRELEHKRIVAEQQKAPMTACGKSISKS